MKKYGLLSDSLLILVSQVISVVIPLLLIPLLISLYSASSVANVVLSLSLAALLYLFFDFGINTYGVKRCSDINGDQRELNDFLASVNGIKLISFVSVFVLVLAVYLLSKESLVLYILIAVLAVFFQSLVPIWLYQSELKVKQYTIFVILGRCAYILFALLFSYFSLDLLVVFSSFLIGWFFSSLLSYFYLIGIGFKFSFKFRLHKMKSILVESLPFYLSRVSLSVYTYSNVFVVGAFLPSVYVTYYGLAEYIYKVCQSITGAINQASYPRIMKENNSSIFYYSTILSLLLVLIFVMLINFNSSLVTELLIGEKSSSFQEYIAYFSVLSIVGSLAVMFGFPASAVTNNFKYTNNSNVAALFLYLLILGALVIFFEVSVVSLVFLLIIVELFLLSYRFWGYIVSLKRLKSQCDER
ncbi:oligosaccharide flippase family protein [Vibrio fluvialis]|nr:oligosaccharide flippase family protein [Vibrio fluvialis]